MKLKRQTKKYKFNTLIQNVNYRAEDKANTSESSVTEWKTFTKSPSVKEG